MQCRVMSHATPTPKLTSCAPPPRSSRTVDKPEVKSTTMSSPIQLDFVTVDVFTSKKYEGNPLAIVRIPHGIFVSQEQKQAIAREFNLSEATFLHEKGENFPENTWTVDIFLTTAEIPFAGHPTIGTACYALARVARERSIEEGVIEGRFTLKAGPVSLQYDVSKKTARAAIPHDVSVGSSTSYLARSTS
jgi:PhzF family phenazine biosynthesis protein